jgi:hypothetical protein
MTHSQTCSLALQSSPPRLIAVSMLCRTFSAGASIAARSLKYVLLAETIMEEELGPERIATMCRLSACKAARPDCAFILLAGSVSKYKSVPQLWSAEPEATIIGVRKRL